MQLMGTKHYSVQIFSEDMDDFMTVKTTPAVYYKGVMERLLNRILHVRPGMRESGDWFLLHNALPHSATIVKPFWPNEK
jgi:hypothetical protein